MVTYLTKMAKNWRMHRSLRTRILVHVCATWIWKLYTKLLYIFLFPRSGTEMTLFVKVFLDI